MKIAVGGKGGVGKTFIAGGLAGFFAGSGRRVIAIDADASPNLALTLGLSAGEASVFSRSRRTRTLSAEDRHRLLRCISAHIHGR